MKKHKENRLLIGCVAVLFAVLTLASWLHAPQKLSLSERRRLAQKPKLTIQGLLNGSYMDAFDAYAQDQFPMRDALRTLKAVTDRTLLGRLDSHDIYLYDGYAAKIDATFSRDCIDYAAKRFNWINERYLAPADCRVWVSVVPDKSCFLAEKVDCPRFDSQELVTALTEQMPYAEYINIFPTLTYQHYYRTDTHWRQEKIKPVADTIATALGVSLFGSYEQKTLDVPFRGVYAGQSALNLDAEPLVYLENETLQQCTVYNWETNQQTALYDFAKAAQADPYELFLSGSVSMLTITNPHATTSKHLIMFRDSFGSSLAPYLVEAYQEITLVDIRYLKPEYLSKLLTFDGQDVLFLYSVAVLNHSEALK